MRDIWLESLPQVGSGNCFSGFMERMLFMKKKKVFRGLVIPAFHLKYCEDGLPSKGSDHDVARKAHIPKYLRNRVVFADTHSGCKDKRTKNLKIFEVYREGGEQDE